MTNPNDTLTIKVGDDERDLFMSYGLLSALTRKVGDLQNIPAISMDDDLREGVLKEVLAERTASGKIKTPVEDLDEIDISVRSVEAILAWVTEHLSGFFVRSLVLAKKTLDNQNEATAQFSENGSGQ